MIPASRTRTGSCNRDPPVKIRSVLDIDVDLGLG